MTELTLYTSTFIMTTPMKPVKYLVDKMITQGLYILAGAPKVGKSWLALDLCLSVAKGEQFLNRDTDSGYVVYLSLEDSLLRLQNRLYELTDEPSNNLSFALTSGMHGYLNEYLSEQEKLMKFLEEMRTELPKVTEELMKQAGKMSEQYFLLTKKPSFTERG